MTELNLFSEMLGHHADSHKDVAAVRRGNEKEPEGMSDQAEAASDSKEKGKGEPSKSEEKKSEKTKTVSSSGNPKNKRNTSSGGSKDDKYDKLASLLKDGFASLSSSMTNLGDAIAGKVVQGLNTIDQGEEYYSSEYDEFPGETGEGSESVTNLSASFLQNLTKEFSPAVASGPAVDTDLARLVDTLLCKKEEVGSIDDRKKKYLTPSNCHFVQVPKINRELWDSLSRDSRAADCKLQKVQGSLLDGVNPIIRVMESLYASMSTSEELNAGNLIKSLADSVAFIGNANVALVERRRELIRSKLPINMQKLCSSEVEFSGENLFGNNFPEVLKNMKEVNRISEGLAKKFPSDFMYNKAPKHYNCGNRGRTRGLPQRKGKSRGRWYKPYSLVNQYRNSQPGVSGTRNPSQGNGRCPPRTG